MHARKVIAFDNPQRQQQMESAVAALYRGEQLESTQNYDDAVAYYTRGIESMMELAKTERNKCLKDLLMTDIQKYLERAECCREAKQRNWSPSGVVGLLFRSLSSERSQIRTLSASSSTFLSNHGGTKRLSSNVIDSRPIPNIESNTNVTKKSSPENSKVLDESKQEKNFEQIILDSMLDRSPGIRWKDIAGLNEAKQVLQEAVIFPYLRPDLFTGLRAPPNGVLLYGPPGTGKTMLAKAVATESNFSFFSISASSLTSKWVGEGEKLVRALFRVAASRRPCVIFIDEIDSILSARTSGEHEASRRLKTEFMVQIEGTCSSSSNGVLLMGATNTPWDLDEAVLRRLSRRVYVPLPDVETRLLLIRNLIKDLDHKMSHSDFATVAASTENYSCSDIKALTKEAAMIPLRDLGRRIRSAKVTDVRPIQSSDFEAALSTISPSVTSQSLRKFKEWESRTR